MRDRLLRLVPERVTSAQIERLVAPGVAVAGSHPEPRDGRAARA